jgi:hypothetical protein
LDVEGFVVQKLSNATLMKETDESAFLIAGLAASSAIRRRASNHVSHQLP